VRGLGSKMSSGRGQRVVAVGGFLKMGERRARFH
jgi:hypothetical protein